MKIQLPVRQYKSDPSATIEIEPSKTVFLMVDCDGEQGVDTILEDSISPALKSARDAGIHVVFIHNGVEGVGGPKDIVREIHSFKNKLNDWKLRMPSYNPAVAPLADEPQLPKSGKNGFDGTLLDYCLKSWGIDTIIAVGFSIKSCLYHTCLNARHHNYRVVMLRDCTNSGEFPDTRDPNNPEGGWVRFVFLRLYETDVGFTSTSEQFVTACRLSTEPENVSVRD